MVRTDSRSQLTDPSNFELFCDGASRGNPGPGSFGFVIYKDGVVVSKGKAFLGTVTNNIAEYRGLIAGLEKCAELGVHTLLVKTDSELLVRQLKGEYRVRASHLLHLFERAKNLLDQVPDVSIVHIPRELNSVADALANLALDEK